MYLFYIAIYSYSTQNIKKDNKTSGNWICYYSTDNLINTSIKSMIKKNKKMVRVMKEPIINRIINDARNIISINLVLFIINYVVNILYKLHVFVKLQICGV
ncbi:MAG: hypothetical protein Ta2E_07470 [Mycoplasmoidaceae bacterium]|nr:MAG: hypothetical protein Ta2E_07470 [Mycoplasmoidaceae bacterium]